ncbi:hypothetical protein TNCT_132691 [Trichonephila clavata]|uniref:Uncharacterized protein n=2 Tax=Trichonephila TaxID=2585208 RepID=A0A8X6LXN1_TRICU|nr:hypothetical protein TNCT_132691 [Trichonephila clavata]
MVNNSGHFGIGTMPVASHNSYDHPPSPPNNCAGCGYRISDRFYYHMGDGQWHAHCLKCYRCDARLDQAMSCYFRDGHIYCKDDYFRLIVAKSCSRCHSVVNPSEMVMRVKDLIFHLQCFTCAFCNAPLAQGDTYGMRDNFVYCRSHYDMITREFLYSLPPTEGYPYALAEPPVTASGRKGRPRKKKNGDHEAMAGLSPIDPSGCNIHLPHLDGPNSSRSTPPLNGGGGGQRTKRMRTSFKHHQLRTMKSYFAINQNPDAKDLKQLAAKTSLSKRVLQVWFQNARAKWRRNNSKQEPGQPGMMGSDQSPNSQLQQVGLMGSGLCSPGATSSYSESSPVHSCGGMQSDGSMSTQMGQGQSMDFDSSNPLTPLVNHGHNQSSVHNGDIPMSYHGVF